ncbi:hypothetical protein HY643_00875 [Candidatus Woesearchaeota archaeon]|nr:hypothetical protein [Candidatus Woesearchaeota archaeon]
MIQTFIQKFTQEKIEYTKIGSKYFLATKSLIQIKDKIKITPLLVGLYLGEEKEGKFAPSLALLEIIAKTSTNKVFIKDIGEMDFIYGKKLRSRHILKIEGETKVGFLKLIQNEHDENLGLGKISKEIKEGGTIIKNKMDRGDFLRREMD